MMRSQPRPSRLLAALAAAAVSTAVLSALELKPRTLTAFNRYVELTEARMKDEVGGTAPFLWIDRQPPKDQSKLKTQLTSGEVAVAHLETRDGKKDIDVPDGLIHHWIGTVFLPDVKIDKVIAFVQEYDQYPSRFSPTVQRTRILKHDGNHFEVMTRTWSKKMTVTVVMEVNYDVEYTRISPTRVWTKSVATDVKEIQSPGQPGEKAVAGDQAGGYLWRINNYCSFEERPEGTYEQCESISLTRQPPFGTGWIVKPFVTGIPRETLEFTLGHVRSGLAKEPAGTLPKSPVF